MGMWYYITPIYDSNWSEINWENIDFKEAKKFIKENPMPKNTLYKNEEELLDDIKHARGMIAFSIEFFTNPENKEFFKWFLELLRNCWW